MTGVGSAARARFFGARASALTHIGPILVVSMRSGQRALGGCSREGSPPFLVQSGHMIGTTIIATTKHKILSGIPMRMKSPNLYPPIPYTYVFV